MPTIIVIPTTDDLLEAARNALDAANGPQFSKAAEFAATDIVKVTFKRNDSGSRREVEVKLGGGFEKFLAAAIAEQK